MRFMKLIPAPLSTSKDECKAQFSMLLPYFSHFQIDIQDGIYVPNKTIELQEYLAVIQDEIPRHLLADQNPISVTLDLHLMLSDYTQSVEFCANALEKYNKVKIRAIFIHANISQELLKKFKSLPFAMTFSPPDEPRDWTEYLQISKYAQVMTIYPGPQGQQFMPEMLTKIGQIHEINPHIQVCIDGAVNDTTYPIIKSQPSPCVPDELAIGSYFSKANPGNIASRIHKLSE